MKTLKVVLVSEIKGDIIKPLNLIINKCNRMGQGVYELWQDIQHIDLFFDESGFGVMASHDEKDDVIEFRDHDSTVLFYIEK